MFVPPPLNHHALLSYLSLPARSYFGHIIVLDIVDSTNDYLLTHRPDFECSPTVCLAEQQTSGRGRRGRVWESPKGANIFCSISLCLAQSQLHGLNIVMGLVVGRMLSSLGLHDYQLKWPNDIYYQDKKLSGILIETSVITATAENKKENFVVIGIGINVAMPLVAGARISQPWTDLQTCLKKSKNEQVLDKGVLDRNKIVGLLLNEFHAAVNQYEKNGIQPFIKAWMKNDFLLGKWVFIEGENEKQEGWVQGIDESGALLIQDKEGKLIQILSGDISITINRTPSLGSH